MAVGVDAVPKIPSGRRESATWLCLMESREDSRSPRQKARAILVQFRNVSISVSSCNAIRHSFWTTSALTPSRHAGAGNWVSSHLE
jgi:hypothetical protein